MAAGERWYVQREHWSTETVDAAVLCTWWTVPILLGGVRTLDTTYACVMVWWLRDHVWHTRLRGCAGDVVVLMACVRV